ncbi:uncharacterized protein BJ171DRAFT_585514 [Polychytrium aggregatum]|uniref:uncharacterized protein n=1 Tax=Polychytrium aggregatum TaxID=110093 RepID=UPI0022FE991D|nr:uncharacterized protein BJ171DRAFT_585514 [Polychytrium aggregatum]KAI9199274.1 hypothetical protein BJ171DRAFT_585514 [Polychytrium aggregatum]
MATLQLLPTEVLISILGYLRQEEISKLSQTCQALHGVGTSILWKAPKIGPMVHGVPWRRFVRAIRIHGQHVECMEDIWLVVGGEDDDGIDDPSDREQNPADELGDDSTDDLRDECKDNSIAEHCDVINGCLDSRDDDGHDAGQDALDSHDEDTYHSLDGVQEAKDASECHSPTAARAKEQALDGTDTVAAVSVLTASTEASECSSILVAESHDSGSASFHPEAWTGVPLTQSAPDSVTAIPQPAGAADDNLREPESVEPGVPQDACTNTSITEAAESVTGSGSPISSFRAMYATFVDMVPLHCAAPPTQETTATELDQQEDICDVNASKQQSLHDMTDLPDCACVDTHDSYSMDGAAIVERHDSGIVLDEHILDAQYLNECKTSEQQKSLLQASGSELLASSNQPALDPPASHSVAAVDPPSDSADAGADITKPAQYRATAQRDLLPAGLQQTLPRYSSHHAMALFMVYSPRLNEIRIHFPSPLIEKLPWALVLPRLRILDLRTRCTSAMIRAILENTAPSLLELHLSYAAVDDAALETVAAHCPSLTTLAIAQPAASRPSSRHLGSVARLSLNAPPAVTDSSVVRILRCCSQLRHLSLLKTKVSSEIYAGLSLAPLRSLSLSLNRSAGITPSSLIEQLLPNLVHLERFELHGEKHSTDYTGDQVISEDAVYEIAAVCPHLKQLKLFDLDFSGRHNDVSTYYGSWMPWMVDDLKRSFDHRHPEVDLAIQILIHSQG